MASTDLPLAGAVVVDLSDECLSLAGRLLAELGADVVRVEAADGDVLRADGPRLSGRDDIEGSLRHVLYNATKRSVAINFEAPGVWDLIDRLLAGANIVLAPLEKSIEARRALASERLRDIHPHLGLVDVVPRRGGEDLAATDLQCVAAGGLPYGLGYLGVAPDYPAGKLAYKQASLVGAALAIAMLYQAQDGGAPGHACISLQEAIVSTTIHFANENMWRLLGVKAERPGGEVPTLLQAADGGWVTFGITPNTPQRFKAFAGWLAETVGYKGLVGAEYPGEVWATPYGSESHQALVEACARYPRNELCERGQALGFLVVPVNTVEDLANDPHLRQRGCFVPIDHPGLARSIEMPRNPIRSTAYEPVARPAPLLGEHTAAALSDVAGIYRDEFERLAARGVVPGGEHPSHRTSRNGPARERASAPAGSGREGLPLAGIRVIDFCWMAAGPLVTEMLANLGADVIKVESLARLDTLRNAVNPVAENPTIETGAFFQDCNTDKRSITLNLGTPGGIETAKRLIAEADVVTENFTAGVIDRLGLGYGVVNSLNPGIVMASFPVMGATGPKSSWRGIGNSVVAMCGLAWHTGHPDRKPTGVLLHTDFTLAPLGALAIVAALLQRGRTGKGQFIELAQYEAGTHLLDTELIEYLANGMTPPRPGNRSRDMAPHGFFPGRGDDRWVAICARDTVDWLELCRAMGRMDLLRRDDLRTLEGRRAAEDEVDAAISKWTAERDPWEAADLLQKYGVPAGPLEDIAELVERDPSLRGFFLEFEHPAGVPFMAQNQPFLWNGKRLPIRPAPLFGEHNDEVFRGELRLVDEEVARLVMDGVIY